MEEKQEKPAMTVAEAGRRGGQKVKEKYGTEFYQEIGRKGGQATKDSHGPDFYSQIGLKGGRRMKQLIEDGKRRIEDRKE